MNRMEIRAKYADVVDVDESKKCRARKMYRQSGIGDVRASPVRSRRLLLTVI